MKKSAETVMKTAAAGMVLGTAAGVAMNAGHAKSTRIRKKAAKAMKNVGTTFESISKMM